MGDSQGSDMFAAASDSVSRRYQAAYWLQCMIGPFELQSDPSEEDLRIFLKDGTVLFKLLNKVDPDLMTQFRSDHLVDPNSLFLPEDCLSMFLKAVEQLKMPVFEILDLAQPDYQPHSSDKVVDCILSLKSYHDSIKEGKSLSAYRKFDGSVHTASIPTHKELPASPPKMKLFPHLGRSPNQQRKRWMTAENDSVSSTDTSLAMQNSGNMQANNATFKSPLRDSSLDDENFVPNHLHPNTGTTHLHHINQKVREVLRMRTRGSVQEQSPAVLNSLDNSSQSVSSLVNAILGDKQPDEIPALVEIMLKNLTEDFERRLVNQNEQVANLKSILKEHLTREDKLAYRAKLLETLAAGTGEEVAIVRDQLKKMKTDKKKAEEDLKAAELLVCKLQREREDYQVALTSLERELLDVKQMDEEQIQLLQAEKEEIKSEIHSQLDMMKALHVESNRRLEDLRLHYETKMQELKEREVKYQTFLFSRLELFQDFKLVLQGTKQACIGIRDAWQQESRTLEGQLQGLIQAASGYHNVLAENRRLYNEVQDLKGNIRVYCRVRPFLPGQELKQSSIEFVGENGDLLIANPTKQGKEGHRIFNFNKAFGPSVTQEAVFMDTRPLIRSVLDGYNVCIFAYGQTGSGKTYTMTGPSHLTEKDWGVNYRALNDLFQISQSRADVIKYEVGVQMVEIYNEQVRDLLLTEGSVKNLDIRNYSQLNGLNVPDATTLPVTCTTDVLELIKIGQKNRAVGSTALNERSSRSHSVLTVHVQGNDLETGAILRGCLHLVDLAGSERVDKSEATGDRLKEAQHINKSLSALGDVISALSQKSNHVPYRNSKLTQLLQHSLSGQAKTLMFIHVSPDMESYGETISTLKFAERVASVELGAARSNKESKEVRDLKEQVTVLKEIIAKKDGEIDRLQTMRVVTSEIVSGVEKGRPKTGDHLPKPPTVDIKQQNLRRPTSVIREQKEKSMMKKPNGGTKLLDVSNISPPTSPKENSCLVIESNREKLADLKKQFQSEISDSEVAREDADPSIRNVKKRNECTVDAQVQTNEWGDRVHSSTDSSLCGTDDLLSGNLQAHKPETIVNDTQIQEIGHPLESKHRQSLSFDFAKLEGLGLKKVSISRIPSLQNNFNIDTDRPLTRELDTGSEQSDGYASQAETDGSQSSMVEHSTLLEKVKHQSFVDQRKPPQPQRPVFAKNEWKQSSFAHTNSHSRRQTMSVSTASLGESTSYKKQHLQGKRGTEASAIPLDASQKLNSTAYKSSKRWV